MQKLVCVLILLCSALLIVSCKGKKETSNNTLVVNTELLQPGTATISAGAGLMDMKEYHELFSKLNTQKHRVSGKKISVITADKGLRITIDPSKLQKENGEAPGDEIEVNIIELTNAEELFKANATTVSNGKLLSSGGCYYIGMNSEQSKLKIKMGEALQVEFPVLKQSDMELFYAERDSAKALNWQRAGYALQPLSTTEDSLVFREAGYEPPPIFKGLMHDENGEAIVYRTLQKKVYLNDKMMTVQQLIDTLNKDGVKIVVDTVRPWPKLEEFDLSRGRVDTSYLEKMYGPEKQFVIRTVAQAEQAKAAKEERDAYNAMLEKNRKEARERWQSSSLVGALQKYYSPAPISQLGWINCDRFYEAPLNTEIECELPITFNGKSIQYFLLYTSINGCMQGHALVNNEGKMLINRQPAGTAVTIVAFTKMDGEIFHCKKNIVTGKDRKIVLQPEPITIAAFTKIFGRNVKV